MRLKVALLTVVSVFFLSVCVVKASTIYTQSSPAPLQVNNSLEKLNESISKLYKEYEDLDINNKDTWYFKEEGEGKDCAGNPFLTSGGDIRLFRYNQAVLQEGLNSWDGKNYRDLNIVYGSGNDVDPKLPVGNTVLTWKGKSQSRYLGFTIKGFLYENPNFPWDAGWNGVQIQNFKFIKYPWYDPDVHARYIIRKNEFTSNDVKAKYGGTEAYQNLEALIQIGMDEHYAGVKGSDIAVNCSNQNYVYDRGGKPKNEDGSDGEWVDFVQVIQPPTYYSWGTGWAFLDWNGDDNPDSYMTVPIAPFSYADVHNLYVRVLESTSSAPEGTDVTVVLRIMSTFDKTIPLETSATWKIYEKSTNRLLATEELPNIIIEEGQKLLRKTYKVPSGGLKFVFSVNNTNPPKPEEGGTTDRNNPIYLDNEVEIPVNALQRQDGHALPYELYYDVLSRKAQFGLGSKGNSLTLSARLELPPNSDSVQYYWDGPTVGGLTVTNGNERALSNFTVENNDPARPDETTVTRTPIIKGIVLREKFGDKPGEEWKDNFSALEDTSMISFNGKVSKPYGTLVKVALPLGGYTWVSGGGGTISAYFQPGSLPFKPTVKVYHGEDQPVSARGPVYDVNGSPRYKYNYGLSDHSEFSAGEQSTADDPTNQTKKFAWEGRRYLDIPVLRYMYHAGVDGNPEGDYEPILGKLPRKFQHKDTAEVKYEILTSYKDHFEPDRQLAEDGKTKRFENAPFATDLSAWQGHDGDRDYFPLKAGYYYRPYAQYKATVKTVSYLRAGEKSEHAAIVEKVKDSFWAQTTLSHSDENGNEISVPYEIDRNVAYRTDLVKRERLQYSPDRVEDDVEEPTGTNGLYKRLLEGWDSSATVDSFTNYKYREYVKPLEDKEIYRIEEVTEITFTVNPHGDKFYTHPNLRDNDYTINAGFAEFTQSFNNGEEDNEVKVSRIEGPDNDGLIDTITFTIFDSMFDDVYNESR